MITVVSTGLNAPTKAKCRASVASQSHPHQSFYVEAGEQTPPRGALENRAEVVRRLDPEEIVVVLDGDDWFPHSRVLDAVARMYQDPLVWLTYGQFVYADGRPGFASAYTTDHYRREEWRATHLMTYRAALFHHLTDADLKRPDGTWRQLAGDQASMIPMLEMAGPGHVRFCSEVLYVYNFANAFEFTAGAEGLAAERQAALEIRDLPPRERLAAL